MHPRRGAPRYGSAAGSAQPWPSPGSFWRRKEPRKRRQVRRADVRRVAFLFFWPAYAGGAAARLFGPALSGLARHGREFGLAFAAALSVHLALVLWLFLISAHPPVGPAVIVTFGLGALWLYALAAASLIPVGQVPSPKALRIFRTAGLNTSPSCSSTTSPLPAPQRFSHPLEYLPFS